MIEYKQVKEIDTDEFIDVLVRSGLSERRPVGDRERVSRMIANANLLIEARDPSGHLIGIARALTDYSYCCYLSDLAVDRDFQGRGVGRSLMDEMARLAGEETTVILVSAPGSSGFYERVGIPKCTDAFVRRRVR